MGTEQAAMCVLYEWQEMMSALCCRPLCVKTARVQTDRRKKKKTRTHALEKPQRCVLRSERRTVEGLVSKTFFQVLFSAWRPFFSPLFESLPALTSIREQLS